MKFSWGYIFAATAILTICLIAILGLSKPLVFDDQHGQPIVLPLEKMIQSSADDLHANRAIFSSPNTYLTWRGWKIGSNIEVFGIYDNETQDAIVEKARYLVGKYQRNRVEIVFKTEIAHREENSQDQFQEFHRLPSQVLRKVRIPARSQ